MKYWVIICCFLGTRVMAQPAALPKDTSFTIRSSFEKEVKKRPYITIATIPASDKIIEKKDIVYRELGERKLLLDIYYPRRHKKNREAVLLVYGGGWKSGDKSQNEAMARYLAAKGSFVVSAEYRLSGEAIYPNALYDLKAAVRWILGHAPDYGRYIEFVTVMGCSAGGQLAAMMGTTNNKISYEDPNGNPMQSAIIQAVIDVDGILAFKHPESEEGPAASLWLGGTYQEAPANWEDASPLNHVDKQTVPFLFINSSLPRFHAGRDDMIRKMNELGIYSEIHTIPDTPHPFWFFNPWFEPVMKYVADFLKQQKKNHAKHPRR